MDRISRYMYLSAMAKVERLTLPIKNLHSTKGNYARDRDNSGK